jgi:hypothetical protein
MYRLIAPKPHCQSTKTDSIAPSGRQVAASGTQNCSDAADGNSTHAKPEKGDRWYRRHSPLCEALFVLILYAALLLLVNR